MNSPSLIILDRDGVINEDSRHYIKSPYEWHALPNALEAISQITHKLNIPIAIATNQSGIARGYFTYPNLHAIHQKLLDALMPFGGIVDYIAICPHGPYADCHCRKPQTGMLEEIAHKLMIPLDDHVYFVGDSYKDYQSAYNAGVNPVMVKTGKGEKTLSSHALADHAFIYDDLYHFITNITHEMK